MPRGGTSTNVGQRLSCSKFCPVFFLFFCFFVDVLNSLWPLSSSDDFFCSFFFLNSGASLCLACKSPITDARRDKTAVVCLLVRRRDCCKSTQRERRQFDDDDDDDEEDENEEEKEEELSELRERERVVVLLCQTDWSVCVCV